MRKNYSLFGMPEKVIFCKKCIISTKDLMPRLNSKAKLHLIKRAYKSKKTIFALPVDLMK